MNEHTTSHSYLVFFLRVRTDLMSSQPGSKGVVVEENGSGKEEIVGKDLKIWMEDEKRKEC